jgi:hypothetical protein
MADLGRIVVDSCKSLDASHWTNVKPTTCRRAFMGPAVLRRAASILILVAIPAGILAEQPTVDDSPKRPGEWGFHPADGEETPVNPPNFVWRPQKAAASYELECSRDPEFRDVDYRAQEVLFNCHCPPNVLRPGRWYRRFRFRDRQGTGSRWSKTRWFDVPAEAVAFPMPTRQDLLARIPKQHPRLFVRPEQMSELRKLAHGERKDEFQRMVQQCENLMRNPPPVEEPRKYPQGMVRGSDPWLDIWWANRTYTIRVLNGAATLAFTRLLGGREEYGQLARRLLLAAAEWDPKGSTGYRYNDEAGMPYNYYFARTYTFLNDLLTEEEKEKCREVMSVRGTEMYEHLCPRHLWQPYASHSNRAWHFLGEVGIAFLDEIPEAADWVWFAMDVFFNVYPVWCDSDGGWHEGSSYWSSYVNRFTWWADVMRAATGVDAYKKPYFSNIGYYAMYLQPPGTRGGGFGDLTADRTSRHNRALMSIFAAQAANPYWQWYVDVHGGPLQDGGYIGFLRGTLPRVAAKPPVDLPSSRCFWGTGQAVLNTNLLDASNNVEIIFKSSPFGTQSHGYEAQNSFLLYAFGERLLIRTGRRDSYGSKHHREWMWHTKSTNCITVNGESQGKRTDEAIGEILTFHTSASFDFVAGEAGRAYGEKLNRFTRSILFVKPELVVIFDQLEAPQPSVFDWWLHSPTEMAVRDQKTIRVTNGEAACLVSLLAPEGLKLSLTDQFDPPPGRNIKLVQWHLTAQTAGPLDHVEFVSIVRPHRASDTPPTGAALQSIENGYALDADLRQGRVLVLLRTAEQGALRFGDVSADADLAAYRFDRDGRQTEWLTVAQGSVRTGHGKSAR